MTPEEIQIQRVNDALAQTDAITNDLSSGVTNVQAVTLDLATKLKAAVEENAAGDKSAAIGVLADKIIANNEKLTPISAALLAVGKPAEGGDGGTPVPVPAPPVGGETQIEP